MQYLSTLEAIRDGLGTLSGATTSLYVPRPVVQIGGEKWRILQKNVLSELEVRAPEAQRTRDFITDFDVSAFRGLGVVAWEDGKHFKTSHLARRPIAALVERSSPFLLPFLADVSDRHARWVLALNLEKPVLYFSTGDRLINQRTIFDAPKYEDVHDRRDIQDDVFFHASSRGASTGSKFHALGADRSDEAEKTEQEYFRDVIDALEATLPPQVRSLHVAGDPAVVGHFAKLVVSDHLSLVQHHGAGEALRPQRLLKTINEGASDFEPLPEGITSSAEILKKAKLGQVERLYISENLSLLEGEATDADEHLRLRGLAELPAAARDANQTVLAALVTGAALEWRPQSDFRDAASMHAVLRWID